jgi:hypothetical protein
VQTAIDLRFLPPLDKHMTTALCAAIMCHVTVQERDRRAAMSAGRTGGGAAVPPMSRMASGGTPRKGRGFDLLVLLLLLGPVLTVIFNTAPIVLNTQILPGLGLRDAVSSVLQKAFLILPFLLARRHLATAEAHATLLRALCHAGLAYSLLALIEVRLSPQINVWIYGFFPHSFAQHIRAGGFRPIVFLQHGLWVGMFFGMSVLATLALARLQPNRAAYACAAVWLLMTLYLSKNLGALTITLALGPLVLLAGVRLQLLAAAAVAALVLAYPAARTTALVPLDGVAAMATYVSPARAESFAFRLRMEDILQERAMQSPVVGWGGWKRSRMFDEAGRNLTVTDGHWIIVLGHAGWFGYIAEFGLLSLPLLLLAWHRRRDDITRATAGLSLVLAASLIDLIPNATLTSLTWLVAGALAGRCGLAASADPPQPRPVQRLAGVFTRFDRLPPRGTPLPEKKRLA